MNITIDEILKVTKGHLSSGQRDGAVLRISTDTRKLQKGDFFWALQGNNFDGNAFLSEAIKKGALGAVVSGDTSVESLPSHFNLITVLDSLSALGDLAHYWRKKFSIPLVAITGSSGKTTTKEMIVACLSQRGPVCANKGNFNNLIGLPLTLFEMNQEHLYGVVEMGMNAFGEIGRLTEIAEPTIGLITNVGRAHLEGVGDVQGVARAKSEMWLRLKESATAIINRDDPSIMQMKTKAKKISFGYSDQADIQCVNVENLADGMRVTVKNPQKKEHYMIPVKGAHHVFNWLSCYTVCFVLGLGSDEIQKGISRFRLEETRGAEVLCKRDIVLINDCYNANPDSMVAALRSLHQQYAGRRKIAVLGDMLELGEHRHQLHQEVGKKAAEFGIEILFSYGECADQIMKGFSISHHEGYSYHDREELQKKIEQKITSGDVVLIKGSRGVHMEMVVEFLKKRLGTVR